MIRKAIGRIEWRVLHWLGDAIEFVARRASRGAAHHDAGRQYGELAYINLDGALQCNNRAVRFELKPAGGGDSRLSFHAWCEDVAFQDGEYLRLYNVMREKRLVTATLHFGGSGKRLTAACAVVNVDFACGVGQTSVVRYELDGVTRATFS